MPVAYSHCYFMGRDPNSGKFVVKEELYPEARGWIEHEFETEQLALDWLETLKHADV